METDRGKGWVKLHRKILDNEMLWADTNAYIVFTRLLILVDSKTGTYRTGRFVFAELMGLKPTTAYQVLKRLEKNGMVTLRSNNKYTVIGICNWQKYQGEGNNRSDNTMTTRRQPDDNQMTHNKNKEIRNNKEPSALADLSEPVRVAVTEFIKHRKALRKPMTDQAVVLFIKKVQKLWTTEEMQIAGIEYAIERGWQSVFPIKDEPGGKPLNPLQKFMAKDKKNA